MTLKMNLKGHCSDTHPILFVVLLLESKAKHVVSKQKYIDYIAKTMVIFLYQLYIFISTQHLTEILEFTFMQNW